MEDNYKEVYFHDYCPTCKHRNEKVEVEMTINKDGEEVRRIKKPLENDTCDDCLNIPARQYSHRPEHYKEDAKAVAKLAKNQQIQHGS